MLIVMLLISIVWLGAVTLVLAVCWMAAEGDGREASAASQRPRRPSTWGTVRSMIFKSPHSDQLTTYR
jgi:hypothetical protein